MAKPELEFFDPSFVEAMPEIVGVFPEILWPNIGRLSNSMRYTS